MSGCVCSCQCPLGWKGALCSETVSVCDGEHSPPPLCAQGSTCIPLPNGYTCRCPLGTAGIYCDKGPIIKPLTVPLLSFAPSCKSSGSHPFSRDHQRSVLQWQPVILDVIPAREDETHDRFAAAVPAAIAPRHPGLRRSAPERQCR